jgi:peptidoglycan-N-acetylglucosamine deacetylase
MLFRSPPAFARKIYKGFIWQMPAGEKKIYLTFDDGPHPETTPFLLEILNKWNAGATFFCLGKNVTEFPGLFQEILGSQAAGNHSFSHKDGFFSGQETYLKDVQAASKLIPSNLFRPPFGRIYPWQATALQQQYKIIMWDVMGFDFLNNITPAGILNHIRKNTADGSIIVLHENNKSFRNLKAVLPVLLKSYTEAGFSFDKIMQ